MKMTKKTRRTIKFVLLSFLVIGLLVGLVGFVSNLAKNNDDFVEIYPTYELGGIDENGKFLETKTSLYTKKSFDFDELKIELDFDSDLTYQLFFYDKKGNYVSCSEIYDSSSEFTNKNYNFVRIVIMPLVDSKDDNEECEISFLDKLNYLSQIKVSAKVYDVRIDTIVLQTTGSNKKTFELKFELGMTWGEWLESEYNTYDVEISNNYIIIDGENFYTEELIDETYQQLYLGLDSYMDSSLKYAYV